MWGLLAMLMISIVSYATWRGNPNGDVFSHVLDNLLEQRIYFIN
jgi:hypothetical protein